MWKCTCYTLKKKLYLWLIHVDVWQKLTQYCKSIILKLKTLKSQIIIYIMSNLCTYIIFTYTCIWIENSLEKCVLKYQERWFLSGETEIISALFFIPFSTFDFSKTNKLDFFLTFWTQVFPKISEYESWKWLLGSLSLTSFCCCHKSWFKFFLPATFLWRQKVPPFSSHQQLNPLYLQISIPFWLCWL